MLCVVGACAIARDYQGRVFLLPVSETTLAISLCMVQHELIAERELSRIISSY